MRIFLIWTYKKPVNPDFSRNQGHPFHGISHADVMMMKLLGNQDVHHGPGYLHHIFRRRKLIHKGPDLLILSQVIGDSKEEAS